MNAIGLLLNKSINFMLPTVVNLNSNKCNLNNLNSKPLDRALVLDLSDRWTRLHALNAVNVVTMPTSVPKVILHFLAARSLDFDMKVLRHEKYNE